MCICVLVGLYILHNQIPKEFSKFILIIKSTKIQNLKHNNIRENKGPNRPKKKKFVS